METNVIKWRTKKSSYYLLYHCLKKQHDEKVVEELNDRIYLHMQNFLLILLFAFRRYIGSLGREIFKPHTCENISTRPVGEDKRCNCGYQSSIQPLRGENVSKVVYPRLLKVIRPKEKIF